MLSIQALDFLGELLGSLLNLLNFDRKLLIFQAHGRNALGLLRKHPTPESQHTGSKKKIQGAHNPTLNHSRSIVDRKEIQKNRNFVPLLMIYCDVPSTCTSLHA